MGPLDQCGRGNLCVLHVGKAVPQRAFLVLGQLWQERQQEKFVTRRLDPKACDRGTQFRFEFGFHLGLSFIDIEMKGPALSKSMLCWT
jgi:hypothetical protein